MDKINVISAFTERTLQSGRKELKFREVKELALNYRAREAELVSQPSYPDPTPRYFESNQLPGRCKESSHSRQSRNNGYIFLPP